jgi:hypothetical protein
MRRTASLAHLSWRTGDLRRQATKEWIREKMKESKAYIPREKTRIRIPLRNERKAITARYY